jgi:CBS domain-containing protein
MINVNDILKEKGYDFFAVTPSTITLDALKMMAEKNVGAVLVVENNKLAGIFSERDYARKIVLKGKTSINTNISECMTHDVITVTKETSITDCMQLMTDKHIRHLPVIEEKKIVGLVSIGDIVSRIIREQKNTIQQLENYIIKG